MKLIISLCILLFSVILEIKAQEIILTGKVTDSKQQPVAYASIALMGKDGQTLITGTISNADGLFSFRNLDSGPYILSVSFVGYKPLRLPVDLKKDLSMDCMLEEEAVSLGEVTVEANRSNIIKQSAKGQTFMLSEASMRKKDIIQALQEIPALIVNPDTRKLSLSNGSTPLILVNGVRRDGGLSAINPENIISVDIVQTASAEFMREGYTSVVNINTKKEDRKYTAFNGGINSHPAIRFGIADMSLETGNSHFSLYVTAQSFAFLHNKSDMFERTSTAGSLRELTYKRDSHYNDTYMAIGGDKLWSKADYSSFSVTFNYIPQWNEAYGQDRLSNHSTGVVTPYSHWRELKDKSYIGSINLYHKHQFADKSVFDCLLQLNLSKNINKVEQVEENKWQVNAFHYDFHNSRRGVSFIPSYKFQVAGCAIKIGVNTYFQSNRIDRKTGTPSAFKHEEWDEYVYVDASRAWGNFSLAASVGIDAVFRDVEGYKDRYYNLRPVINMNYRFNAAHSLMLSYNMQSVAPNVIQLNPYNTSSDTLTVSSGNPFLKPYRVQNIRLGYTCTGKGFYVEPFFHFRQVNDAIVATGEDKGGYYVKSLDNQLKYTMLTGGINLRYTIKKVGFLGMSMNYNHIAFSGISQKNDYITGRFYGGLNYKKFGLNFSYGLPDNKYDMYTRAYSSPESNATLSYDISKSWNLSAGMRFIGWKKHVERWVDMPDYSSYYDNRFTNRANIVMMGVRYKFQSRGKTKREQKKLQNTDKGFRVISE